MSNSNTNTNGNLNRNNKLNSQIDANNGSTGQYRYQFSILNSDTDSINGNSANNTNQRIESNKLPNYYG